MIYNYDFFVSYASKDNENGSVKEFVDRLRKNSEFKDLLHAKPRVFFADESIRGMDDWERTIRDGIETSRFLIVLLSPNYFQSEMCAFEFEWWLEREIHHCVFREGIAPIQFIEVPGLFDGTVDVRKDLQDRFPDWLSELRTRQSPQTFNLTLKTADLDETLDALCDVFRVRVWRQDLASKPPHYFYYPQYNKNFVGRRKELVLLRDQLKKGCVALYGLGGAGKTELALAYGHAFAWDYQLGRFYINCKNQTSLFGAISGSGLDHLAGVDLESNKEKRLATLFENLSTGRNLIIEKNEKSRRDVDLGTQLLLILDNVDDVSILKLKELERLTTLFEKLSNSRNLIIEENKKSGRDVDLGTRLLLILDNVDDANILKLKDLERLPDFVHIVATTREKPSDFSHLCGISVDPLADAEALELLRVFRSFDNDEEKAAEEIIRKFGRHAFRVEKIGAYLRVNKWETYRGFLQKALERFEHLRETIDADDFELRHEAICDEACLQPTLERLTPDARTLLNYAALFGPDSVPVPWLGKLAKIDGDDLSKGLQELEDYRLLIPAEDDSKKETRRLLDAKLARLHRIAREIVVNQMPDDFRLPALEQISSKIDLLVYFKDASYWLAGDAAWGLDSIFDFCYDRYVKIREQEPPENYQKLIWRFHLLLGLYLTHLRNLNRARVIALALNALAQRRVEAAPDDLQALSYLSSSYNILGALSNAEGERKQAREYYEKALEIRKKNVKRTPEDLEALRDLSSTYNNLGALSGTEGKRKQAREYYEKALEGFEKIVEQTPDNLQALSYLSNTYNNLGVLSNAEGDRKQAREYYEKALEIRKKNVERTQDDLQALSDLIYTHWSLGKNEVDSPSVSSERSFIDANAARSAFENGVASIEKVLTPDPDERTRDTSLCLYDSFGDLERSLGNFGSARNFYEKAEKIVGEFYKENNASCAILFNRARNLLNLGDLNYAEKKFKEAIEYYERFRTAVKELTDKDPTAVRTQMLSTAALYRDSLAALSKKDKKAAREHLEAALKHAKKLAQKYPDDALIKRDLAYLQAQLEEEQPFWRRWFKRLFKR
jgi:tetratricopeptide (TPR) repeat protein